MNAKLLFKTIFLIIMLLLLVMIGLNNRNPISFSLPPILPRAATHPAALMYFAFFAIGVLTGTVLTAGGSKKGGSSGASRPPKSAK